MFLGDYVDRGPDSRDVIEFLRELPGHTAARVVCLRGNHEDAWLRVIEHGWDEFVLPPANGCLATVRSYLDGAARATGGRSPHAAEMHALTTGEFFPPEVIAWIRALPFWHEDEHGIYVHAGLPAIDGVRAPARGCQSAHADLVAQGGLHPRIRRQARDLRPHADLVPAAGALRLHAR
ncbi:MAG: hypothetical protein HC888_19855 [Candidatus Competibacteraceae bacterium]|nr:hypothetical protein [Candidatus Competibacteraceae bacterium]